MQSNLVLREGTTTLLLSLYNKLQVSNNSLIQTQRKRRETHPEGKQSAHKPFC